MSRPAAAAGGTGSAGRPRPWPLLRFALLLASAGALASWSYRHPELYRPLAPLETATTGATRWLLESSGIEVERAGTVLSHPAGFAYDLTYQCTGAVVVGFLVVGQLALPLAPRRRLRGLVVGVPLVLAANLVRLVTLFYVGVHWRAAFDFIHLVLWEALMMGLVLAVWLACSGAPARRGSTAVSRERGAGGAAGGALTRARSGCPPLPPGRAPGWAGR